MLIEGLFGQDLKIINIGSPSFIKDYELQDIEYIHLDWKPPAGGNIKLLKALDKIEKYNDVVNQANEKCVKRIKSANAILVDVEKAINVIPNMTDKTILHAGPPVEWEDMAGPMKGAVMGALIYEGLASTTEEASKLVESGAIRFAPCHEHNAVGPMAGIISPSMPVHVIHNSVHGNYAFCTINEGLGKVLRYGANSDEVINRLKWIENTLAPVLKKAVNLSGGIDIRNITAQALHMGDECHNRNKASTSLFLREIIPFILKTGEDLNKIASAIDFMKSNEHYFLNLSMPMCKVALDSASNIEYSTIVTTMARNGVEFGIRVSGLGENWFNGAANYVKGLLFPGFTEDDAAPDIGDSAITETMGIGGFTMGGAPAIVQFVGGTVDDAIAYSTQMHEIVEDENKTFSIPNLNFRGSAIGIDIRKVIETGILPIINTGMAHKEPGVGQVGAGLVNPPEKCFEKAIIAFANNLK